MAASLAQLTLRGHAGAFIVSASRTTPTIPGTPRPDHMRDNALAGHGVLPGPDFWKKRMKDLEA